ncbi:hypothetical protein TNCV_3080361 [Trichonephila clavipes]|nr:hypothetical protein TNCV_3080361 [Trichonephila clavipes]
MGGGSLKLYMSRRWVVRSLVVRASDSRLEGLGSIPDGTKYPPSTHGVCPNAPEYKVRLSVFPDRRAVGKQGILLRLGVHSEYIVPTDDSRESSVWILGNPLLSFSVFSSSRWDTIIMIFTKKSSSRTHILCWFVVSMLPIVTPLKYLLSYSASKNRVQFCLLDPVFEYRLCDGNISSPIAPVMDHETSAF